MKVTDYIAKYLDCKGIRTVFELPGGMTTHLLHSLRQQQKIEIVTMHHEQGAAFAADAAGRITGLPGIAMATSGPGATNLLTGIGSCYFDSSPAVFITGQVNRAEQKGAKNIRQLGFQETDIVAMAEPITKAAWKINTADEVPEILQRAFSLAVSGRPGPVLVDIPMDIQRADIAIAEPKVEREDPQPVALSVGGSEIPYDDFLRAIKKSQKPLLLVGGGIRAGNALKELQQFIDLTGIPVVSSLMGIDILPYTHPLRVGMIGSYGNRWANLALAASDLLIVLGSRLDIRQTGADTEFIKRNRTIYHIDCEAGELNNRVTGCIAIQSDIRVFLEGAVEKYQHASFPKRTEWIEEIKTLRTEHSDLVELSGIQGINPNAFMHQLSACSAEAAAYVVDVGQHQMWAAQSTEIRENQRWMTSGGMGAMGFSLPAGIGACFALRRSPVVVIAGDGSFQCNIQELQTVVRNKLPLKIVVMNNRCHGMVRQFQESYFHAQYQSTLWGYDTPDFARIADAYGIPSCRVDSNSEMEGGLNFLWENPSMPALLEVAIDTYTNTYPKIAFGRPLSEMEPDAKPIEMEGT